MSKEEFEAWAEPDKRKEYSIVRRDEAGQLQLVPYHEAFAPQVEAIAAKLEQAATLSEDPEFANYLRLRACCTRNWSRRSRTARAVSGVHSRKPRPVFMPRLPSATSLAR